MPATEITRAETRERARLPLARSYGVDADDARITDPALARIVRDHRATAERALRARALLKVRE